MHVIQPEKIVSPANPRSPVPTAQNWSLSAPTNNLVSGWTIHINNLQAKVKARLRFLYR